MMNRTTEQLKIAVIAAHPDDEALGMGGTLLEYKKVGHEIHLLFISDGITSRSNDRRDVSIREKEFKDAMDFINPTTYYACDFPDNHLDSVPFLNVVTVIEAFLQRVRPDRLFTHFRDDLNIDHQIVSSAAITASRPGSLTFVKEVLCFEALSSTDWNLGRERFSPNYYVDISNSIEDKIAYLNTYKSEMRETPHARSLENIRSLSKIRGAEVFTKYAEAFILLRSLNNAV